MVAPIDQLPSTVYPGEEGLVATMTLTRRREFVATRHLARLALHEMGEPPAPIPWGAAGEPRWSTEVVGSLSHAREIAAAVLSKRQFCRSVGVDIDDGRQLDERSSRDLMTEREIDSVRGCLGLDEEGARRWVFSAKEAIYKCQYPATSWADLNFEEVEILAAPENDEDLRVELRRENRDWAKVFAQMNINTYHFQQVSVVVVRLPPVDEDV